MNIIEDAKKGISNFAIQKVSKSENIPIEVLSEKIADGRVVIPLNLHKRNRKKFRIIGIGEGLRTKINANIGSSPDRISLKEERKKLMIAISLGADTVMDLSTGGDLERIRKMVLEESVIPVGTVPIYEAVCRTARRNKTVDEMDKEELFDIIENQLYQGVDFITVHCGVTIKVIETLERLGRVTDIVSRGGSFLAKWILHNKKENPLFEEYDRLLKIAKKYDACLSLGDGLRPGCLQDATDIVQIEELSVLGELAKVSLKENVQVMIEGPGHIPLHQVESNVVLEKSMCNNAPFYVLGPLVTDISAGYDHITAAIGGAVAAWKGADFLCYVTPSEHLGLPDQKDVEEGVIAMRIAAHAADIAKGIENAPKWDLTMSKARKNLDWRTMESLSLNKNRFQEKRKHRKSKFSKTCSMCGKFCAIRDKI